jgi:hypothetical protein
MDTKTQLHKTNSEWAGLDRFFDTTMITAAYQKLGWARLGSKKGVDVPGEGADARANQCVPLRRRDGAERASGFAAASRANLHKHRQIFVIAFHLSFAFWRGLATKVTF